ncbi:hypothetical protein QUF75_12225 [Desulfococcaceae bacterium HSG7]|nr:hypothetical protein [Desulfococcaceae bacterium HSG7]
MVRQTGTVRYQRSVRYAEWRETACPDGKGTGKGSGINKKISKVNKKVISELFEITDKTVSSETIRRQADAAGHTW